MHAKLLAGGQDLFSGIAIAVSVHAAHCSRPIGLMLSLIHIFAAVALIAAWLLWNFYTQSPWTRDGKVRAEQVGICLLYTSERSGAGAAAG